MRHRLCGLDAVLTLALVLAAVALAPFAPPQARLVPAAPLVLLLPGWWTVAAIPGAREELVIRLTLSLAASLAITVLDGLLLHFLGEAVGAAGLTATSWAVSLGAITLGGCLITCYRTRSDPPRTLPRPGLRLLGQLALFAGAIALTGLAVARASHDALNQRVPPYTQLWLVPDREGDFQRVHLGIKSLESHPTVYDLRLVVGQQVLREWPAIALAPSQTWEASSDLSTLPPGGAPIEALLYRDDGTNVSTRPPDQTPYRSVSLARSGPVLSDQGE